jgi:lipoprotein
MKKSLSAVIASVIVCMIFSACGISKKDKKETTVEETTIKEETKESKEAVAKVVEMKNTAVNDGNLVGNMVCYGRMVNNKDEYYFRNPKDQERIYSVDMAGNVKKISGDIFMKDMHMLDGVIYYANTTVGDQKDTNFTDRNLYKYSTYTGENTKLTDLGFGTGDDSWLSFESLVDNYCYFSYSNGADGIYHIARVKTDGSDLTELFTIPAGQNVGNPNVSVVDRKYVYFLSKDGLNCYDMESKQNKIAIPNFDCQNYFIYDGTIYYTEEDPYLRSCDLSGGNQRTVYDGSKLGFNADSIQFNIYNNTLYALIKSYAQHMGSLKRMNLDGSNVADIAEDIKWFNIVNGNVFLRYWDGKSKPDTELYTYNIAANTPIGQLVNFDAAMANAKPEVSTQNTQSSSSQKGDEYYLEKYAPVINEYRSEILANDGGKTTAKVPESSDKYGFYDINGNGSKEMLITSEYFSSCLYLYTLHNDSPELIGTYGIRRMGRDIMEGGYIYEYIYEGTKDSYNIYKLDDRDNLVAISLVSKEHKFQENGMETYIYTINNTEVSRDDFDNFCRKYGIDEESGVSSKAITGKYPGTRSF